jgi:hypothetical protein
MDLKEAVKEKYGEAALRVSAGASVMSLKNVTITDYLL